MERFNFSWDKNKDGDVKAMLEQLIEKVPEYSGWTLARIGGYLLASGVSLELNKRGIEWPPMEQTDSS